MKYVFALACMTLFVCTLKSQSNAHDGMVLVKGRTFVMGSTGAGEPHNEKPAHSVTVSDFWMDAAEVTNAQFAEFVAATKYVTVAERPVNWEQLKTQVPEGTPRPADSLLQPGSLVFRMPAEGTTTRDVSAWWEWTLGADWKHPEGPTSTIQYRMDHPVVHVCFEDATAYAAWKRKRLPTEAEWELAALAGSTDARFTWGDRVPTERDSVANIWQGIFPWKNTTRDGYVRTSPVRSYPPNALGLYDVAGNVWEWCSDLYRADAYEVLAKSKKKIVNPRGPSTSWDPNEEVPTITKHVIRGGSFLCHVSYCESYRVRARRGESPDTGMSHIGFRCVEENFVRH